MDNLRKKLNILNCEDIINENSGTDFGKILNSIKNKAVPNIDHKNTNIIHEELDNNKEDETFIDENNINYQIKTESSFKESFIYKTLLFYKNIDFDNKQVFKEIDLNSISDFFTLNPKFDTPLEKFIKRLEKDPLIYGKSNIEVFYCLLIVLNYLEMNNKKSLSIEHKLNGFKQNITFLKDLKALKKTYYFNIFNAQDYNKYLLYLQPIYTIEMETLFLNYCYVNKIGINLEFIERLFLIMRDFQIIIFKKNQFGKNFINHRLSVNNVYTQIKRKFFNITNSEKAILILRIIFFWGSPLFDSLDVENMIRTIINLLNTLHKNEKDSLNKIYDFVMEFYYKTNNRFIVKTTCDSELFKKFTKYQKNVLILKNCINYKDFQIVFSVNLNDFNFYKLYLNEIILFSKLKGNNFKIDFNDMLSFYEHFQFIISTTSPYYSFQTRNQLFVILGNVTKSFLDKYSVIHISDNEINSSSAYERYKNYANYISKFLKGIEKNILNMSEENTKKQTKINKSIPNFLIIMREFEDFLNIKILKKQFPEDYRINRRGFILETRDHLLEDI